jgi:hypothetical protein
LKRTVANFTLQQASAVCEAHKVGLTDALFDLERRRLTPADIEHLGKEDRRLLDQFAYRYTRLQDDMGVRLMPAILRALGEEITAMPAIDRLNRLEQLGWLPSAEEWAELRRIRNQFAHEYPETSQERFERLQLAVTSARRLLDILANFSRRTHQRFPAMHPSSIPSAPSH